MEPAHGLEAKDGVDVPQVVTADDGAKNKREQSAKRSRSRSPLCSSASSSGSSRGRGRSRSRSRSRDNRGRSRRSRSRTRYSDRRSSRRRHHSRHRTDPRPRTDAPPQSASSHLPPSQEALPAGVPCLNDACCVRLGVFHPLTPVTREQVIDEMDAVRMTKRVEHVIMEPRDDSRQWDAPYYARVYFASPEQADLCAVELNTPRRPSKWKHFVTQRLPRLGPMCGEIGTIPTFEPFHAEPPDSIAVEMAEGFVVFSTDELYRTKGAIDYLEGKQQGRILHRLLCKHFDPQRHLPCRFGLSCNYIHVKAIAMWKLLLPISAKLPLRHRYATGEGDGNGVHTSLWEYSRRLDTLVLRYLQPEVDAATLTFMFEGCEGYVDVFIQCMRDGKRFGFVRFTNRALAFSALQQTAESNLNISYYGVMEELRRVQSLAAMANGTGGAHARSSGGAGRAEQLSVRPVLRSRPDTHFRGVVATTMPASVPAETMTAVSPNADAVQRGNDGPSLASGGGDIDGGAPAVGSHHKELPFPPLPDGWNHGMSRRTSQYYFFQPKTKNSTTWKHPLTGERYSTTA